MTDLHVLPSSTDETSGEREAGQTLRSAREAQGMSIQEAAFDHCNVRGSGYYH